MALLFKDRGDVTMLSTAHGTAKNPCTDKFEVLEMNNRRKSLVEQTDQIAAILPFLRRTSKWHCRKIELCQMVWRRDFFTAVVI
ncbi:hypothetical protein KIN20_011235 [Parelaphostrongylus tenuis]|uniref:Uncharacterized protein n=1 Tax=Parelaphostrongylus tenuis TaxID=148309 RepID=A0AAD5MDS4_PARTN|nr:hypothetical protein KIN20_011235 [Parelaphostrongylus tenuis]